MDKMSRGCDGYALSQGRVWLVMHVLIQLPVLDSL